MLPGFLHILPEIKIYNLRIVPTQPIFGEISGFKKQFLDVFGIGYILKSKPHITLCTFAISEDFEGQIIKTFDKLSYVKAFKVILDGFGMFIKYKCFICE